MAKLCHHLGIAYAEPVYANPEKGKEYSSLEAAYDAYLKALEQYDSVRQP